MTPTLHRLASPPTLALGLGMAVLSIAGCSREVTPAVVAGVDACAHCNMVIDDVNQAAGWIEGREFVTFDSPGCLLARYETLRQKGEPLPEPEDVFFADLRDGFFHPAAMVTFLLTTHRPTVMDSGALAFGSEAAAEQVREHDDETLTDWVGYRTVRGTPDREVEVSFGPEGMVPERVEIDKGELVAWTARNAAEEGELALAIKGYPELEPVRVAAGEGSVSFRLLASRPGSGFPVIDAGTDEVLGVVVVRGAHTADEEAEGM
jgi:hypothetical protein